MFQSNQGHFDLGEQSPSPTVVQAVEPIMRNKKKEMNLLKIELSRVLFKAMLGEEISQHGIHSQVSGLVLARWTTATDVEN